MAGKRAERRHQEERIKRKVAAYYSGWPATNPRFLGKVAHSRALCSGMCCGNRRRYEGERISEKRRAQS